MRLCLPVLFLVCPLAAWAWGKTGHSVVCEIAFAELSNPARREVKRLMDLDSGYETFAESCNWADVPPRQREFDHYVNFPRNTASVAVADCPLADTCLFRAIDHDIGVLSSAESSDRDRLEALKLLGHWLGDIHQPMHVTFADDRGANWVEAVVQEGDEPVDSNLHAVWDYWIISRRLGDDWREIAAALHGRISDAERDEWRFDGPVEWAEESFRIARAAETQYCIRKHGACWYDDGNMILDRGESRRRLVIDDGYAATHIGTVERRLAQAGVRLGELLNRLFE